MEGAKIINFICPKFEVVGGCWRSLIGGLHLGLDLKIIGFVTLVVKVEIVSSEALAQISGVGLLRVDVALVGWGWWVGGLGGARFLM